MILPFLDYDILWLRHKTKHVTTVTISHNSLRGIPVETMTLIALKIQQAPGSAMWRADVWYDSSESTHQYMVLMVCKYGCNMLTIQKCGFLCHVWTAPVLHVELSTTSTATYLWRRERYHGREEAQEPTTHSWNEKALPPCWLWPPWSVWAWATAWATEHPMELNSPWVQASVMYLGILFDVIWGMCYVFKRDITGPILGKHPIPIRIVVLDLCWDVFVYWRVTKGWYTCHIFAVCWNDAQNEGTSIIGCQQ